MSELLTRDQVPVALTWDLTTIFKTDEDWEHEFSALQTFIEKAAGFAGTLNQGSEQLLAVLRYQDELFDRLGKVYVYASLKNDQDTTNSVYQGFDARAGSLYSSAASSMAFLSPEILAIEPDRLEQFLNENEDLALYRHLLEEVTMGRPYTLSDKEEALLAGASEVFGASTNTYMMLNNADMKFPTIIGEDGQEIEITHGRYGTFLESANRDVRRAAFNGVYAAYQALQNTFATTISGQIKKSNFSARVRGFESARHAALFNNHIPEAVHEALIAAVNERIDLLHRYVGVRQKMLKLDDLRMYDLYTPVVADVDLKFSYEEAQEIVIEALAPLGAEYQAILKEAFDSRWIDVLENVGKRSGAYSSGVYSTNPYILLNWQDTLDNVFTLAHELGHSLHSYYTRKNQPFIYGDYSIFLAEVASTTNENLLTDYLLKKYDDKSIRAFIINHYLDGVKGTIFRQTQFAEFEHLIHKADQEGTALTAEFLTENYFALNKKYYGEAMTYDDAIGFEWARIPHFYMNYYVYQYATGFSAASALSAKILHEGPEAVEAYLGFLKAGSSDFPIEVLQKAGVDMTTSKPVIEALAVFKERLDELEELLNR